MGRQINIYIKATPLSDVNGRVGYVSSPERQEFLEAVHNTTDSEFWKGLAHHCQEQAKYSKSKKPCEAREFMCSLDNSLSEYDAAQLAEKISDTVKAMTNTENLVALHWNKKGNNYHCHIIVAENQEVNVVKEGAVLTKDTYYGADGKRSIKSKCIDPETKELLPGCRLLKKGERKIDFVRFGPKIDLSSRDFSKRLKSEMVILQNELLGKEKYKIFENDGIHIAQQHVGKGMPADLKEAIEAKNALIKEYNMAVDKYQELAAAVSESEALRAQEELKEVRSEIKTHAMTDRWLEVIQLYIRKFREKIATLQKQIVFPETKKRSLAGILSSAEGRGTLSEGARENQRKKTDNDGLDSR